MRCAFLLSALHVLPAIALQLPSLFGSAPARPFAAAATLRDALVADTGDEAELNALVDELMAARVPFRGGLLADGALWRASFVRGTKPRWRKNAELLPFLNNRQGQAYAPFADGGEGGTVLNYGEVLGRALFFKAVGSFTPVDARATRCPKDFDVSIERGGFVLGEAFPFLSEAISGPGYLRCRYIDEELRIFESPQASPDTGGGPWEQAGLIVVQVRDDLFADAVVGPL